MPALALSGAFATAAAAKGGDNGPDAQHLERFMERRLDRMLEHVDATAAQETQIKALLANHKAELTTLHQERRQLKEATRAALTAPTVDAAAVEQLRAKMVAQMDKSSRVLSNMAVQVGKVLTQEQRQQLADKMGHGHGRGHGGPMGF